MMKYHLWPVLLLLIIFFLIAPATAQPPDAEKKENISAKPFKILTSGKRITVQAKQNIKTVIVWTANGHRMVEQKEINSTSYTFNISIPEKVFFVRVDMADGKMFTQKIGVH